MLKGTECSILGRVLGGISYDHIQEKGHREHFIETVFYDCTGR
jgi:hypothetical protein